ncbi:fibroblast growth factor receptor 1-like isoform X2 [Planococcus citri]|uniref:fibroblast growth factor receptor 1-like isoform X2 n=1 Tax=Planococcus citri TaxID=170843 RepID=UPI0031F9D9E0
MRLSIYLHSNATVALGLAVIMTTFSLAISLNSTNCGEQMKRCKGAVLLTCNSTKMTSTSYWYRLSPERMMTMLENASHLSDYEVKDVSKSYETTETWLSNLSPYDNGLYSCLDRSKPREEQVICCIRLNVSCNGIENNDHIKQHLQKIENGDGASPYTLEKTIHFIPRQTDEPVVLRSFTRGYPKPTNSAYATNYGDFSGNELKLYDDESHLFLTIDEPSMPTTYTIRTCNAKGCIDNIFHSVHQTGNNTVVIGEIKGASVTLCCDAELNSTWRVQWFIKNRNETKNTKERWTAPKEVPCYFIFNVSDTNTGTYQCRKQDLSTWKTIGTFELKILNDSVSGKHPINQATVSAENDQDYFRNGGSITNILIIILITALSFTTICVTYFSSKFKKEMRKINMELEKMTKLQVKKIIVQKQISSDNDSSDILNIPVVTIQCLRSDEVKNGMISNVVYEMPLDERWEFPRHNLRIGRTVGEGEFGIAAQAEAKNIPGRENQTTIVAVKMLKVHSSRFGGSQYPCNG